MISVVLSLPYWLVISLRNWLFDAGLLPTQSFDVPIVSVGNISVGGTGKTPTVAHLVEKLSREGKKAVIISRGYGGQYKQKSARVELSEQAAYLYGDEPSWYAKKLQVPVYVGRRRASAARQAIEEHSDIDVIVADDGFQHRWLKRDIDIVLIDTTDSKTQLLPLGRWREPLSSLDRAHVLVLTKYNLATSQQQAEWHEIARQYGFAKQERTLFEVHYKLGQVYSYGDHERCLAKESEVILAAGIAQPTSFKSLLDSSYTVRQQIVRPDHHHWSEVDQREILSVVQSLKCKDIVVTEKDAIKFSNLLHKDYNIWVAPLQLEFSGEIPVDL